MEPSVVFFALSFLLFTFLLKQLLRRPNKNLPPSPPSLPILGHLYALRNPLIHRAFKQLSDKYGPIIYLRLGAFPVLVVSSPGLAEECCTTHDVAFANRPNTFVVEQLVSDKVPTIGFSSYSDGWRNIRRVAITQFLAPASINFHSTSRTGEVRSAAARLFKESCAGGFREVNLSRLFLKLSFDLMTMMLAGRRWRLPLETFEQTPLICLADFLPMLRWIGYTKLLEKNYAKMRKEREEAVQELIENVRRNRTKGSRNNLIESLMCLQDADPESCSDHSINQLLQAMYSAGTDTSSHTETWAMSLLLNNPDEMEKAKNEIDDQVKEDRLLEDSDLPNLHHLQRVVMETLRLFPAAPLLLPHFSSEDSVVDGYFIPKGTTLLINAWAIQRDPSLWDEPDKFIPDRFRGIEGTKEGYRYIPFGMGRRACPGANLAIRQLCLTLGTFIQCFDWKRNGDDLVDLEEGKGLILPKANPLVALYKPRDSKIALLSSLSSSE